MPGFNYMDAHEQTGKKSICKGTEKYQGDSKGKRDKRPCHLKMEKGVSSLGAYQLVSSPKPVLLVP
jgi:hypothetical protein